VRQKPTLRHPLRSLLAASALALLAATGARAETPEGVVVMAKTIDDIISLDPAEVYEFSGGEVITNVYERLMRFEPEDMTRLVGAAVESYEVSADGKTFTFKVRPGQTFHSGNPVTAEDLAFSLQRVVKLDKTPAFLISQMGFTKDNVDGMITAPAADTLQVTIGEDFSPSLVLNLLSAGVASVVEKKLALENEKDGDLGYDWLRTHSAGSGPFVLRGWKPNESVIMDANPAYRTGAPKVKRVVLRHVPEAAAQRLMLEKDDVDIARDLTADQIQGLAGNPDVVVTEHPGSDTYYMALNQKDERLANPKVRQAFRWLVDYQGMADTFLKGQFIVHQAFWPRGFPGSYDETPFHLDVAKGKALLAEAGYPDGFEVQLDTFNTSPMLDIAQSIQSTLGQAGIKVNLVQNDQKQLFTMYRARQHQVVVLYWAPDYMDPHSNADSFARNSDNSDNPAVKPLAWRNAWYIPEITARTDAAVRERDTEKRMQMYRDLQKDLQEDGPFVIMFQPIRQIAARKSISGFVAGPTFDLVYYRLMAKS
jgi:peptide/nickel transport system substrate-binding protein